MKCNICGKDCKCLGNHIKLHGFTNVKDYYDIYLKQYDTKTTCACCGKPAGFSGRLTIGYTGSCGNIECTKTIRKANTIKTMMQRYGTTNYNNAEKRKNTCLQKYGTEHFYKSDHFKQTSKQTKLQKYNDETFTNATKIWKTRRNDITYFEKEYDCTNYATLIKQYGQGFVKLNLPKTYYKGLVFINNDYIDLIQQYTQEGHQYHIEQTKLQRYGDAHYNNINKIQNTRAQRYKDTSIDIWSTRFKNIEQFEQTYNCTRLRALIKKYGQGWLSLKLPRLYLGKQNSFVSNKYIHIIENYTAPKTSSKAEEYVVSQILKWNKHITIIRNNRKLIAPLELDIYLPEHNIAIEYNGIYWHNSYNEKHTPKNYHLKKSLMCRAKHIRLVHIYEFEDIEIQIKLLLELLDGTDNYNKNDFNKNNLIELVPSPELIYEDKSHNILIYGAGKLYE